MCRLEVQAPFFHFSEVGDELGETATLAAEHLTEAIEELLVRKMIK